MLTQPRAGVADGDTAAKVQLFKGGSMHVDSGSSTKQVSGTAFKVASLLSMLPSLYVCDVDLTCMTCEGGEGKAMAQKAWMQACEVAADGAA